MQNKSLCTIREEVSAMGDKSPKKEVKAPKKDIKEKRKEKKEKKASRGSF